MFLLLKEFLSSYCGIIFSPPEFIISLMKTRSSSRHGIFSYGYLEECGMGDGWAAYIHLSEVHSRRDSQVGL